MKDELLNDLEGFVDSDWEEVYEKFKTEEYKKEIDQPVIPDFPTYEEFYQALVDVIDVIDHKFHNYHLSPRLARLIHFVTRDQSPENKQHTQAFSNLWKVLCDRRSFRLEQVECKGCRKIYSVAYTLNRIDTGSFWSLREYDTLHVEMRHDLVFCVSCGRKIFDVVGGKLIGVFKHRRLHGIE